MKKIIFCLAVLMILPVIGFTWNQSNDENLHVQERETELVLDSMGNKVILTFENDAPAFYSSDIFTPVCQTGECLPIKIKIFWNLNGTYQRFEMPEGEILTKLNHIPFSPEDYLLLDEILRNPSDPRMSSSPVKHSEAHSQGNSNDAQSSPSPQLSPQIKMDKHKMVDGMTGATLPEMVNKFIPGALYTTYTLWGLANDISPKLFAYTRENLYQKYMNAFIVNDHLNLKYDLLLYLEKDHTELNGHANMLMVIIDTVQTNEEALVPALVKSIYFNENTLDTVCNTLHRKYFTTKSDVIKKAILSRWVSITCTKIISDLSKYLPQEEAYTTEILFILNNRLGWSSDIAPNLLSAIPKLALENKVLVVQLLRENKAKLTPGDLKQLKKEEKKLKMVVEE